MKSKMIAIREFFNDIWCEYIWTDCGFFTNTYYYFYHIFYQTHLVNTKFPRGCYYNKYSLMEGVVLELIDDFVSRDKEDAFGSIDWESDEYHSEAKHKMIDILYSKHIKIPEMKKEIDRLHDMCFQDWEWDFVDCLERPGLCTLERKYIGDLEYNKDELEKFYQLKDFILDQIHTLEEGIEKEKQRILHLAVDVRNYLWT